ncbi:expressed unknown protein [Seminavis robusta]|uniref:RING-type domain-containing protein n=1 Tax=Seminavis robusta TaxID=568900 RepID=A0A9N8EUW7_9STRA|nr:expressed unknown protein [Seminavis robusta]|eukprot:Sro2044_g312360.1 n/a (273) ;mRNA; r:3957-4775
MATTKINYTSSDICVICLEHLLCVSPENNDTETMTNEPMADFGAAAPCGHPAHASCFEQWSSYQKKGAGNGNKGGVPCPTCQKETTSFVKIYLRASQQEENDRNEEEDSHSDEEETEEEEEGTDDSSFVSAKAGDTASADNDNKSSSSTLESSASSSSSSQPNQRQTNSNKSSKASKKKVKPKQQQAHKKVQWYKKRWMGKCEEVKNLKLEAQNRKNCHHKDLLDLERSRLINYGLAKELERTEKAGRIHRNMWAVACFTVGCVVGHKFLAM